ncbi:transposase [Dactylosporangium sp. NPDC005572]|uniref:transposase n=1 Tax=Dactylosporangium sp. NPDC005572 TaxID=3156889 RepID=UPI0033B3D1DE
MVRPDDLLAERRGYLHDLLAACPHLAMLAQRVREFADIRTRRRGPTLDAWTTTVDNGDPAGPHAFVHGLRMDRPAVVAGLTLPYSNGPTEGANLKVKLLKRQMYGRAEFLPPAPTDPAHVDQPLPPSPCQSRSFYSPAKDQG